MATIKHDADKGTTWIKWRAGGRAGQDCSATFDTRGGSKGPNGWAAFAAALTAEGHPVAPSGWVKQGRRWVRTETTKGTTELLGSYGLRWIQEEKRGSEAGRVEAAQAFLRHIEPTLGRIWLDELRAGDVERWQRQLERKLAPATIKNLRSILRGIVQSAVRDGYADVDVVALISKSGSKRQYHSAAIPLDELPLYLAAAHKVAEVEATLEPQNGVIRDGSFGDLVEVLLLTGLRIGELSALMLSALLPPTGKYPARLVVSSSMKIRVVDGKRDGRESGKPKTDAGVRTVELSDRAYGILRRRAAASKLRGELYLFPGVTGGPMSSTTIRDRWLRMLDIARELGAEVPQPHITESGRVRQGVTLHGLRRTYISYRLALGHDVATVQRDAGHANASTTLNVYTESVTTAEQRAEQAAQLGAILERAAAR